MGGAIELEKPVDQDGDCIPSPTATVMHVHEKPLPSNIAPN